MEKTDVFRLECIKCKHRWIKRTEEEPVLCPKCKTHKWKKAKPEQEDVF